MVSLIGSPGNDTLLGDPTYSVELGAYLPTDDTLLGFEGDDQLEGRGGNDGLFGGPDTDTLYGNDGNDMLFGEDGDDTLYSGNGDDTLYGGSGTNKLFGGPGNDTYTLSNGVHLILDEQGDEIYQFNGLQIGGTEIADNGGNDTLYLDLPFSRVVAAPGITGLGREGTDLYLDLNANGRPDTAQDFYFRKFFLGETGSNPGDGFIENINGQSSALFLSFRAAFVYGTNGADYLLGLDEDQTMLGYDGNDDITGNRGNDQLYGGNGRDSLSGSQGNDIVYGDAGPDGMGGDKGDDTLIGGAGQDELDGGKGRDRFVFDEGAELTKIQLRSDGSFNLKNTKGDRINDFKPGQDLIVLDQSRFKGLKRLTMTTTNDPRMDLLSQKIILNRYIGVLVYNENGAAPGFGSGGIIAEVYNKAFTPVLTAKDFVLVA